MHMITAMHLPCRCEEELHITLVISLMQLLSGYHGMNSNRCTPEQLSWHAHRQHPTSPY